MKHVSMGRALVVALVTAAATGCGGDAARSTIRPSSNLPASVDFTPSLKVTIDSRGSSVGLAGVSPVTFEAGNIPGDKLRFDLQFGDGESASTASSTHVYQKAGTFTATLTAIDAAGRQYVATQNVSVKALPRIWYYAGLNERTHRFEVRRFDIFAQQGLDVRGSYWILEFGARPFTGQLTPDRTLRITLDNGLSQFEGIVPSSVDAADARLLMSVREDGAEVRNLPLTPAVGVPDSPPPRAALRVSGANQTHIQGQEMIFDASGSTGDGLSYGVEFGDGDVSADRVAKHAWTRGGKLMVRAIVVDRFGRADSVSSTESVGSLKGSSCVSGSFWFSRFENPVTGRSEFRRLDFTTHQGTHVTGQYVHPEGWTSSFTGELIGDRDIRIVLEDGTISFTGPISYDRFPGPEVAPYGWARTLVRGGSADGMTILFALKVCD